MPSAFNITRVPSGHLRTPRSAIAPSSPPEKSERVCHEVKGCPLGLRGGTEASAQAAHRDAIVQRVLFRDACPTRGHSRDSRGVRAGGSWGRHGGRMETAHPPTRRAFQLRSRYTALLHDDHSGAVGATRRDQPGRWSPPRCAINGERSRSGHRRLRPSNASHFHSPWDLGAHRGPGLSQV
jgi:hypothetical protein